MQTTLCSALLIVLISAVGCGGSSNRLDVYPVSGNVTRAGSPLVGAVVTFVSNEGKPAATGRTDVNGRYQLTTYSPNDGAAAGKYSVVLALMVTAPASDDEAEEEHSASVHEDVEASGHDTSQVISANLLPRAYTSASTTPLKAEVTAAGPNEFDLKVE